MNLELIIQEIQAAGAELRACCEKLERRERDRLMRKVTCDCDAYPFPHRMFSGRCASHDPYAGMTRKQAREYHKAVEHGVG